MIDNILDLPMRPNDANAQTIGEYLVELLLRLWSDGEGFSGKRPFGNSGWQFDLYLPLVQAELVEGKIDNDGWLETCDEKTADQMIAEAIEGLYESKEIADEEESIS